MATHAREVPPLVLEASWDEDARNYMASLPLKHFMEATSQAMQRMITLACLALVVALRSDLHLFNELLIQYPRKGKRRPGHVVPDNMLVVSDQPIRARTSFKTPVEPVGPFWTMEYVSNNNKRKDYEENFKIYENLKIPYYLIFYPDGQELTLYRHNGVKYVSVKPNENHRYAISELDIEVAILDGWVRYWHKGELLPLPADLQSQLIQARKVAEEQRRRADELQARVEQLERELARAQPSSLPRKRKPQ
jgi:Putative restriction endonuclease